MTWVAFFLHLFEDLWVSKPHRFRLVRRDITVWHWSQQTNSFHVCGSLRTSRFKLVPSGSPKWISCPVGCSSGWVLGAIIKRADGNGKQETSLDWMIVRSRYRWSETHIYDYNLFWDSDPRCMVSLSWFTQGGGGVNLMAFLGRPPLTGTPSLAPLNCFWKLAQQGMAIKLVTQNGSWPWIMESEGDQRSTCRGAPGDNQ